MAVKEARDLLFLISRGERLADRDNARENFQFDLLSPPQNLIHTGRWSYPSVEWFYEFDARASGMVATIGRGRGPGPFHSSSYFSPEQLAPEAQQLPVSVRRSAFLREWAAERVD